MITRKKFYIKKRRRRESNLGTRERRDFKRGIRHASRSATRFVYTLSIW